ncbi:MAG: proline--tRNA ligase [Proteobacteria bacterium]|nr:proline--tRNA ligase [Pseudomonadota bacterium]MDA0959302.1 proline--tRNA ligase [Pseudomonadota bacterium]MDA1151374.1 proline--tRNA ligase [Pseudomonadota bacterium]
MRLSQYFLPVLKETPKEAQIASHRLMLRAGMIQQSSAGIYSWLPLGKRVLDKIATIVREEQDRAGALEILMPTLQPAEIWQESGRYDDYGAEMLRIKDRHERDMLYGPTNEEQVTDIFRSHVRSYKALPLNLYHIQWKFRDEVRPRFGIMRGREFLMKDAYSFDLDGEAARIAYNKMFVSYLKTFARMGLTAIPMEADTGPIGGDMSHEFIILAETGESGVYFHKDWLKTDLLADIDYDADLQPFVDRFTSIYARADEKHDPANCPVADDDLMTMRGIEIGHIFYFGTKYSAAMGATVSGPDGKNVPVHMGSYGIGVSRLVGGIIEASHDDKGIIWPDSVAPFGVAVVNLKPGDAICDATCQSLYDALAAAGHDPLLDDRDERPGAKLAAMDLIGIPWQIVVGPRGMENGVVEVKRRKSGETSEVSPESALTMVSKKT